MRSDRREDELARRFAESLRRGDAGGAESVAEEALGVGFDVAAVHSRLIEPAMVWIGSLWESNVISVAEEHLATAICHGVAARMFAHSQHVLPIARGSRERVLLAAAHGEHHVLGLRLAGDVLEGAGYDVLYMGADVPLPALLEACRVHRPAVVGLTASMWLNVPTMVWEIEELMSLEQPPAVMVGGRAIVHALSVGLRAPAVEHSEQLLDVVARLVAARPSRDVVDRDLAARVPSRAQRTRVGTDAIGTTPAAFSAASLVAADALRDSTRHMLAMEGLADRDALTGLLNRCAFDERVIELSERNPAKSVMLMIDVDRLKAINDGYGRQAGDEILAAVADAILASIRPGDFAARFGGDEFVVLMARTAKADALTVAEGIRVAVQSASSDPAATVSIGVAGFSGSTRLTRLSADRALYDAKESGRNRIAQRAS